MKELKDTCACCSKTKSETYDDDFVRKLILTKDNGDEVNFTLCRTCFKKVVNEVGE